MTNKEIKTPVVFDTDAHETIALAIFKIPLHLALADSEKEWGYNEAPKYEGKVEKVFGFVPEHSKEFIKREDGFSRNGDGNVVDQDGKVQDTNNFIEDDVGFYSKSPTPTDTILVSFKQRGVDLSDYTIRQRVVVNSIKIPSDLGYKTFYPISSVDVEKMEKIVGQNISPVNLSSGYRVSSFILRF